MLLARSAPEGEADEIAMNPDIDTRRSAVGGKADVPATWPGSPLLAISGHSKGTRPILGGMCLDDEKTGRMAFQARGDYQNHAIGWLQRGYSPLALGLWYDFHEFGLHLGNVG